MRSVGPRAIVVMAAAPQPLGTEGQLALARFAQSWTAHQEILRHHLQQPLAATSFRDKWGALYDKVYPPLPPRGDIIDYFNAHPHLRLNCLLLLHKHMMLPRELVVPNQADPPTRGWRTLILSALPPAKFFFPLSEAPDARLSRSSYANKFFPVLRSSALFVDCSGLPVQHLQDLHEEVAPLMERNYALIYVGCAQKSELLERHGASLRQCLHVAAPICLHRSDLPTTQLRRSSLEAWMDMAKELVPTDPGIQFEVRSFQFPSLITS